MRCVSTLRRWAMVVAFEMMLACGSSARPAPVQAMLGPNRVAEVGAIAIPSSLLTRAAAAEMRGVEHALGGLTSDLLFGLEAERALSPASVQQVKRATLARALLERIKSEAEVRGLMPPEDRTRILEKLWKEVDRPPSARVTHAVVIIEGGVSEASARKLAEAIHAATASATTSEDFQARARAVPVGSLKVQIESLPPVTADGRLVKQAGRAENHSAEHFDLDFARAANALQAVGQQSEIVKTAFGFHVIRLDERLPEQRLPPAELEAALKQALHTERAGLRVKELLDRLNTEPTVQVERSAKDLLQKLTMEP
ncbi:MAG: peptidyl-prolyl cis-trans isomerase [Polyangiaceae bacterium]|nr:peptidyl-prolyl cis-trans isomerase [Polyangiaceae bacterium]